MGRWLISCCLGLVFLEILLRAFNPLGVSYFLELEKFSKIYRYEIIDGKRRSFLLPNAFVRAGGIDYAINRYGVRGMEFPTPKEPGEKRVIFLGDSHVFGWGVKIDEIFSKRLETLLNQDRQDKKFRIIPAAVWGHNLEEEYIFLKRVGDSLRPDGVMILINPGDEGVHDKYSKIEQGPRSAMSRIREKMIFIMGKTYTGGLLNFACKKFFPEERVRNNAIVADGLKNIKAWADERAIPFIVFSYNPMPFAETYCKTAGIPFFDMGLEGKKRFRISVVDVHPNAEGHRWMTEKIIQFIPKDSWDQLF